MSSVFNNWRNKAIFISILLMLVCLFISRGALSVSMIFFLALAIVHADVLLQWRAYSKNIFLLGLSMLFVIPFISGLWSNNISEWSNISRVKLPLLLFPFAFAGQWQLTKKQGEVVFYVFISLVVLASCWSLFRYLQNAEAFHQGYLQAKIITTPLENDHVRFSWMVSMAVITCLLLLDISQRKISKIIFALTGFLLLLYLHILSARTGLLCFYIFFITYLVWLFLKKRNTNKAIVGILLLFGLPLVSWFIFPTFQNRIRYFIYDISHVQSNTYLPGSNDGNRFLSIEAGWNILLKHPFGVGIGDVKDEAYKRFDENVPGILATDKIDPSSEWLIYGDAAGWPAILLFTLVMALPFFIKNLQHKIFWVGLNLSAAFSFLFDVGLEAQYGVFLYSFFILWWWKFLENKNYKLL